MESLLLESLLRQLLEGAACTLAECRDILIQHFLFSKTLGLKAAPLLSPQFTPAQLCCAQVKNLLRQLPEGVAYLHHSSALQVHWVHGAEAGSRILQHKSSSCVSLSLAIAGEEPAAAYLHHSPV